MSPKDLPDCSLLWEGPQWLSTEEAWPKQSTVKNKRDIGKSVLYIEIECQTIPPLSPHFGGLWEVGVKSVKFHLKRVVGSTNLTFEEFYTLLTQIEAVLNSRPLVRLVDNDIDSLNVLTSSHFLVGEETTGPPEIVERI
ncbi:integrase catalytic domain-containing protein [Trichonephila clavipes]|uniref:Integrase catalytic domain-containing protein n=1 Tax=Trichonephila clavipes TaxID=2585209 RepID=A0A8X6VI13_TRICX|nr:integrase catalytic domain-containing protein [Trichonephila clavipes]